MNQESVQIARYGMTLKELHNAVLCSGSAGLLVKANLKTAAEAIDANDRKAFKHRINRAKFIHSYYLST